MANGHESVNDHHDQLTVLVPGYADTIRKRADVVAQYCTEHGITEDEIDIPHLLAIRALPEWQNATA